MAALWRMALVLMIYDYLLPPVNGYICPGPCVCSQYGFSVDVNHVDCTRRHLVSTFPSDNYWPPELLNSSSAIVIDLSHNSIEKVNRFPSMPGVLRLSISHNQVQDIDDGAFSNLDRLELLDLSHNRLSGSQLRPDIFTVSRNSNQSLPSSLLALDLGYNMISHLHDQIFANTPNLQELRINNNPLLSLERGIQKALLSLKSLKVIDVSFANISSVDDNFFQTLSIKGSLMELHLAGNQLTEVPRSSSILGQTLEILNLDYNPIVELNDTSFFGLHSVRKLSISGMGSILRIAPGTFDSLVNLQILLCHSNSQLNDIDKDAFRELINKWSIKEIHINNNSLETLSNELLPWEKVDLLNLRDNPWNCDCRLSWFPRVMRPLMVRQMAMIGRRSLCVKPPHWSGVSLLDMPDEVEEWCSDKGALAGTIPRSTLTYLVVLAVAVLLLTALAVAILCTRRKTISTLVQPLTQYNLIQH